MKKFFDLIGIDGIAHFFACVSIALALGYFVHFGIATFMAIFIGFAKEIIWDAGLKKGTFQWKDILCDIVGALVGFLILLAAQ